ncbi:MAG: ROK family transcriptional regulator [Spirochaetales bacterium]|nr:ROK family transcriptional regulator [Spirochaetales bacterium]
MKATKRIKSINTSMVLYDLWQNGETSRVEIARRLGLNKSTITHIINEFIEFKLVTEGSEGQASPQGGRKPVYLSLNRNFGSVLGIELRPDTYTALCVDLEGQIRYEKSEEISASGENLSETLLRIIEELREEQNKIGLPLLGIGVGLSGVINPEQGIVKYSMSLGIYEDYNFQREIASRFDIPVFIENDANCCSWGELTFHRTEYLKNFLFVLVEFRHLEGGEGQLRKSAVGLGIVIDGKIHYGREFSAGEFSSVFREPDSPGQFHTDTDKGFRIEEEPEVLNRFIVELSKNISLLVNAFNISQVFFGGDIEKYQDQVQSLLGEEIQRNWPYPNSVECEVRFSSQREKSVAYGAAGMMLDRLFSHPELIIEE